MKDIYPPTGEPGFKATLLQTSEAVPVVSAFGEMDISSADGLRTVISKAISRVREGKKDASDTGKDGENARGCMVLDLGGVDFMDSMGLGILLEARRELLKVSGKVPALICGGEIRELIEIAGFSESFALYDDLESAVTGCSTRAAGS